MHLTRHVLLSMLALGVVACDDDDDDGTSPPQNAQVRVINASPGSSNIQVLLGNNTTPVATLNFRGSTTQCISVPAGSQQTLRFRSGTTDLATANFNPVANQGFTAIFSSNGTTNRAGVFSDNETAAANSNALRFVNASATAGDVHTSTATGTLSSSTLAAGNIGSFALSNPPTASFVNRPSDATRIRFFNTGTTSGTPRADFTVSNLGTRRMATVVLADPGSPAGATAFQVMPCS